MAGRRTAEIGFDFGTSTTMVAYGDQVLQMPSIVGRTSAGSLVFGEPEERLGHSLRSIKRAITYNRETVQVMRGTVEPADPLMVGLLTEAVRRAEDRGFPVTKRGAVRLGCPAMWTAQQRSRLVSIAKEAGLPVTLDSLVDEPVAAGIAWLSGDTAPRPEHFRMLVFDMGGGTLDVAVMDVYERREVAVLAAVGHGVAGDNLDARIVNQLVEKLGDRMSPFSNPNVTRELRRAARTIKEGLSQEGESKYFYKFGPHLGYTEIWYSRDELELALYPLMEQALQVVNRALWLAKLTPGARQETMYASATDAVAGIDVVVLAGGMTHIPYLRNRLRRMFGRTVEVSYAYPPATASMFGWSPEDAIAVGLAQADRFGYINVLRPALDIRLKLDGTGRTLSLFDAYTSLVDVDEEDLSGEKDGRLVGGEDGDFSYTRTGEDLGLPATGTATIQLISHTGRPLTSTLDGRSLDGFPVVLNGNDFRFSLSRHGRIRVIDGAGIHEGKFDDWHVSG